MAKLTQDEALRRITEWLTSLQGDRLVALILYGSAAAGHGHHAKYSDLNVLAVLREVDATVLETLGPAQRWWVEQGNPPIMLLAQQEQQDAADVFPIEYLDIQRQHRVLAGEDVFAVVPHHPQIHRLQVEHDLRTQLLQLRSRYTLLAENKKAVEKLLLESVSSFLALFRHALTALGGELYLEPLQVVRAAAERFQFQAAPFEAILEARRTQGRLGPDKKAIRSIFAAYLAAIQRVERGVEESS